METPDRIARVEVALRAACQKARADGVALVTGAYQVMDGPDDTSTALRARRRAPVVIGCCATGAHELAGVEALDLDPEEWEAIEYGWDGERSYAERNGEPMGFFDLGARLAAEFQPVPANSLEAA